MSATKSNPVNTSSIVTRMRKRRDLETTMNTLKKLLEPSITLTNKKGTRKKNKPRSIAKKLLAPKKINRFEDNSEDGEYYPNKLKRKDRTKKIILKPKHELKVVVATNKRKRGTPHKGLESRDEESTLKNPLDLKDKPIADLKNNVNLKVNTPPPYLNPVVKYELISPPHKSLTELTIEDLIRMDEDSLSDEDLMEVLTCPSPVWWENPPDDFKDGALYLLKKAENSPTVITNGEKHNAEEKPPRDLQRSFINLGSRLKRTGTVIEIRNKAKKIAKLENILGNIKSRVQSDNILENNNELRTNSGVKRASEGSNDVNDRFVETHVDNDEIKEVTDGSDAKQRTLSSSCSDISVNEDDLLRNLESIDIPIIHEQNTDSIENIQSNANDDKKYADNYIPRDDVNDVTLKYENKIQNSPGQSKSDETVNTTNEKMETETVKMAKPNNKNKTQKYLHDSSKEAAELKRVNNPESKTKDILKRLKTSDDILDVRLIQTPTNITNEVKIWSKLDNFKRHNFKPEDFDDDKVINVEDELDFHMIKSVLNSSSKERDPLDPKNDTILIDDDSNDEFDENAKSTKKDATDFEIEKCDVIFHTEFKNNMLHTEIDASKDIIKEDTIRIGNVLDIRLIETEGKPQKVLPKPKRNRKSAIGTALKDPLESQFQLNNGKNKSNDIEIRMILPEESKETISQTVNGSSQSDIKVLKNIEQSIKDYTHQNNGTLKIIDTSDNNKVLRVNDVEVSLVQNTGPIKDIRLNEIEKPEIPVINNDLSITLVTKNDEPEAVAIVPMILPSLTKNPKYIESPKSVKSITYESTTEYSEGTISDSNVQFLDEYDDKNTEECLESLSKPDSNDIEDNEKPAKGKNYENKSIVDLDVKNKSGQNILNEKGQDLDKNTKNIKERAVAFSDEKNNTKSNNSMTKVLDEYNINIKEQYFEEVGDTEDEEANKNKLDGTIQYEVNNRKTEDLVVDSKIIEEEYLDEDENNEIEEIHLHILDEDDKNGQDGSYRHEGRTEDLDENKSIEEEYLDEDSDGKSIGEEDASKDISDGKNNSRQDEFDPNEGDGRAEYLEDDNKGSEEEYLDDEEDNAEEKADESIKNQIRNNSEVKVLEDDNKGIVEEYLVDEEDNEEEKADKSIKSQIRNNSEANVLEDDNKSIEEEYLDEEEDHKEVEANKSIDETNNRTQDEEGNRNVNEEYLDEDTQSLSEDDSSLLRTISLKPALK